MTNAHQPSYLIVFGDSYSDPGNYHKGRTGRDRGYWHGRFTNGPNWSDYLSACFGRPVLNFAVGGAIIDNSLPPADAVLSLPRVPDGRDAPPGDGSRVGGEPRHCYTVGSVPSICDQIDAFVADVPRYTKYVPGSVAIIAPGGNDFIWLTGPVRPQSDCILLKFAEEATCTLIRRAQVLVDKGIKRIVVWNYGELPGPGPSQSLDIAAACRVTAEYNRLLDAKFHEFKCANRGKLEVALLFDVFALSKLIKTPGVLRRIGITDTVHPCIPSIGILEPGQDPTIPGSSSEYFFYDMSHFSTKVHALFGIVLAKLLGNGDFELTESAILDIIEECRLRYTTDKRNLYVDAWPELDSQIKWE